MDAQQPVSSPPSLNSQPVVPALKQLKLNKVQLEKLQIQTSPVVKEALTFDIDAPGVVTPAPDYVSVISAPINGIVVAINAHEGEAVARGEVLLELESLEFADLVAALLQTQAESQYREGMVRRLKQLVEKQIRPQRDLEKAESDLSRARASAQAANARLLAVGVTKEQIERWKSGSGDHPHLQIRSPIAGTITEHLIDRGQAVSAMQRMGLVVNNEQVLIKGFVAPEDAALLQPGSRAVVGLRESPGEEIESVIKTIVPVLDEVNRSLTVNIQLPTRNGRPHPGQNVRLVLTAKLPEPMIIVPIGAVAFDGENAVVFVEKKEGWFEQRLIKIQKMAGEFAIVESGLEAGENLAITQIFSLKALARYEEFAE